MKLISTKPKHPRNPFVAAARFRLGGAHRRSTGGNRQRAKRELNRQIVQMNTAAAQK